jgi:hypothetical protein
VESKLGPLGTSATHWPIVLPRVIVRMETLVEWLAGETEVLGENLPDATLSTTNPTWPDPGWNPGRRGGKPATNRFSYGAAYVHLYTVMCVYESQDIAIGIATGYGLEDREFRVRVPIWSGIFFSTSSRPVLGFTQPPIQWVAGALSSGINRPEREAVHSSSPSAKVKKCGFIHPLPRTPSYRSA